MKRLFTAVALIALPGAAGAQALNCTIPRNIDRPHPELPTAAESPRNLPIGGYTLALTWAPEFCHGHAHDASERMRCGRGNRFGFTLHGLWPDGVGKVWPQYCAATPLLPQRLIAQHLCATPSAQLLQHEWAKHGTCTGMSAGAYFDRSTGLYATLRYPDMNALSRRRAANAGDVAAAIAGVNPGLPERAIRVTVNKNGWLDELWLCLDRRFAYTACKAGTGGVSATTRVKIWRGRR
ncbi:MAG: ribonuclease T [Pseudomonadota bacterium]|nr:ribonuclease T [Pseudomonadota bacterium]